MLQVRGERGAACRAPPASLPFFFPSPIVNPRQSGISRRLFEKWCENPRNGVVLTGFRCARGRRRGSLRTGVVGGDASFLRLVLLSLDVDCLFRRNTPLPPPHTLPQLGGLSGARAGVEPLSGRGAGPPAAARALPHRARLLLRTRGCDGAGGPQSPISPPSRSRACACEPPQTAARPSASSTRSPLAPSSSCTGRRPRCGGSRRASRTATRRRRCVHGLSSSRARVGMNAMPALTYPLSRPSLLSASRSTTLRITRASSWATKSSASSRRSASS